MVRSEGDSEQVGGSEPSKIARRGFLTSVGAVTALGGIAGCTSQTPQVEGEDPFGDSPPELDEQVQGESGVKVIAYKDYACGHCHTFETEIKPNLEDLISSGRMRYEHRDFPVPVSGWWSWHLPNLPLSAQHQRDEAAFWEAHDYIWDNWNNGNFSESWVRSAAEDLDLDPELTWQAVGFNRYEQYINEDKSTGEQQGIPGTPTIVVDGERLDTYTEERIRTAIEAVESRESSGAV